MYRETQTFESLQRYWAAQARRTGITDERGVKRLIQKARCGVSIVFDTDILISAFVTKAKARRA